MRPVAMRPGRTMFAVTPSRPTSRASVFDQPTSASLSAFEIAEIWNGRDDARGGRGDHSSPFARTHPGQNEIGDGDDRADHLIEMFRPELRRLPAGRCRRRTARIVDEDVHRPEISFDAADVIRHKWILASSGLHDADRLIRRAPRVVPGHPRCPAGFELAARKTQPCWTSYTLGYRTPIPLGIAIADDRPALWGSGPHRPVANIVVSRVARHSGQHYEHLHH